MAPRNPVVEPEEAIGAAGRQPPRVRGRACAESQSYGGFLGGAMGFAVYVTWKRLPGRLMADVAAVGLLPAFSIGRSASRRGRA